MGAKFRGCAKINGAKIGVSENCWCAKIKVSKVYEKKLLEFTCNCDVRAESGTSSTCAKKRHDSTRLYFSSTLRENGSGPTEVGVGMAVVREEELEDTDLFESGFDKLHFDINKVKLLSIERRRESMSWITVSVPFCREFETSVPTTFLPQLLTMSMVLMGIRPLTKCIFVCLLPSPTTLGSLPG